MARGQGDPQPPARLRRLVSWQSGRIATVGARATGRRMALTARADFAVLAALDEYGELSQATLGRHLGLDRNNVNGIVDRLNTADHVERRADPLDRRRNILTLTELGRWRLAELQGYADQVQEELLAALTDEERVSLSALLAKVLDSHGTQSA